MGKYILIESRYLQPMHRRMLASDGNISNAHISHVYIRRNASSKFSCISVFVRRGGGERIQSVWNLRVKF